MKNNLPVLILKDVLLFPHGEIRLEFDSLKDKHFFTLISTYYANKLFVVTPNNFLEENPNIDDLSKIGIIAELKLKMDLPNGKTRIIITGEKRGEAEAYRLDDDLIEATILEIDYKTEDLKKEKAAIKHLLKEIDKYVQEDHNMNNQLELFKSVKTLDELTDLIAFFLPLTIEEKSYFIKEINSFSRYEKIVEEIFNQLEIINLENEIEYKLTKKLDDSQREYILREKIKIIKEELGDVIDKEQEILDLREKLKTMEIPLKIKNKLNHEISKYEVQNFNSPETSVIKNYIDWLIALPYTETTKDLNDLNVVKERLDNTHYGLDTVKERILEYLAVKENTNNLKSPIICLVGPPGVGKTTLAKSIAESLGRKSTKISVGGINDEAEIVGHRRTYIGAAPGMIINGMKKVGTTNPVFIIDEIDKMTKDIKGDPASALLEVLDPEQNSNFIDHYIEEEYDLSKVMFITTANYLYQIPRALRDRLEIVELSSYTEYEKEDIANRYLIPKIMKEYNLDIDEIEFEKETILEVIRSYTKEAGVRELERMISSVLRKYIKEKLINKEIYNCYISKSNLEYYLGKAKYHYNDSIGLSSIGITNGLAYTEYGGDTLQIEATLYEGKGNLVLTGSLGNVMKESASIALSYIKSKENEYDLDLELLNKKDIHIHVPSGSIPKDGPSAGVALTTSLISLFKDISVSSNIAMTGEITLRGKVLSIGGVREKVIGAHRSGIRTIYLPKDNESDLDEVPKDIYNEISFILVDKYKDIYKDLFSNKKAKRKEECKNLMQFEFE